jgi:hypothetical protein
MTDASPPPQGKNMLFFALSVTGFFFGAAGLVGILDPDFVVELIGGDRESVMIMSGCFLLVGISDIIIAKIKFGKTDRK